MSVYSELVNEHGFDPGVPGPSATFVGWGYYNPVGEAYIRMIAGTTEPGQTIPIFLDHALFQEVSIAPEEAA